MLKGIDTRQRIEFISSVDISEPKTLFILKPLSSLEMMEFSTINELDQVGALRIYLEKSIVEVKNFNSLSQCSINELIDSIDPKTLAELIIEINKINNLSGGEIKNS
jgi:hypothetical protein